ncbi:MAG: MerR family transcriptional regulator [Micromonosporaceae bacterium]
MGEWTLEELVRRVAGALAADGVRAPNARVTPIPDARIIRWYATIGLVDRPYGGRGRTARYGPRHLLQLVAIKRRQAQGCSLAEIQVELTGATEAMLHRVAAVPVGLLTPGPGGAAPARSAAGPGRASAGPGRAGAAFWAQRPAVATEAIAADLVDGGPDAGAGVLCGIRLGGEAVLLLPGVPPAGDLAAIRAAAGPLLDLLAERGLLAHTTRGE